MNGVTHNQASERVAALWDMYTPKLYGFLVASLRNTALAEDMLQRTWMQALPALMRGEERGKGFGAYLFTIARNECRQHWRKVGREVELAHAEAVPAPSVNRDDVLEVERILAHLDDGDRELLRLRYIADLAVKDIARALGISATAASVRLHRAIKRARKFAEG